MTCSFMVKSILVLLFVSTIVRQYFLNYFDLFTTLIQMAALVFCECFCRLKHDLYSRHVFYCSKYYSPEPVCFWMSVSEGTYLLATKNDRIFPLLLTIKNTARDICNRTFILKRVIELLVLFYSLHCQVVIFYET